MADEARIDFEELATIVRIYGSRGQRAFAELGPSIGEAMHAEVMEVIDTAGYGAWEPFAFIRHNKPKPKTRRYRGNPQLLKDTGNLAASMTPDWNADMVEVYSTVPYVKYHASRAPRRIIPLRDPFAIDTEAFEGDVADMMMARIIRGEPVAAE